MSNNILYFKDFPQTKHIALTVRNALIECKNTGKNTLIFEKREYYCTPETAAGGVYAFSNHSPAGYKKSVFLLKDMKNFTVDCGGSTFVLSNPMNLFILDNCENITIKNFAVKTVNTMSCSGKVIASDKESFDVRLLTQQPYRVWHDFVYFGEEFKPWCHPDAIYAMLECDAENRQIRRDRSDAYTDDFVFSDKGGGIINVKTNGAMEPIVGNTVIFIDASRESSLIAIQKSQNITIENYTAYSGVGMGVIAQRSSNITVDGMKTLCETDERGFSINADATHFVNCNGQITVKNSYFEGQLDDALNVHGVYGRITDKGKDYILVRYMHKDQYGIDIFEDGIDIEISDPETMLPKARHTVSRTEALNDRMTVLYFDEDISDVEVGDNIEDITNVPEVLFENNRSRFNRARGILLASRGRTVVRNNYFNSAGGAIVFESNGTFWFESGCVRNVLIEGNTFDDCLHSGWSDGVIDIRPRSKREENRYFHKNIRITNNTFMNCSRGVLLRANDTDGIRFEDNIIKNCKAEISEYDHCRKLIKGGSSDENQ